MFVKDTVKMKVFRVILLASLLIAAEAGSNTKPVEKIPCKTSADCGPECCCKDENGNVITDEPNGPLDLVLQSGYCDKEPGKQGTACIEKCGCEKGYTCYRPISGACCPPMRCYDSKWVEEQKEFWEKCFTDPNCPLPPVAPQGPEPQLK